MRRWACQILLPVGSGARITSSAPNARFHVSIASAQPSTVSAGVTLCNPSGIPLGMSHLREVIYRFENWNRLRAPGRPYFLRSTTRASRVRKPAFLSAGRKSGFSLVSARLMP